jgi:hypothetical protein
VAAPATCGLRANTSYVPVCGTFSCQEKVLVWLFPLEIATWIGFAWPIPPLLGVAPIPQDYAVGP